MDQCTPKDHVFRTDGQYGTFLCECRKVQVSVNWVYSEQFPTPNAGATTVAVPQTVAGVLSERALRAQAEKFHPTQVARGEYGDPHG